MNKKYQVDLLVPNSHFISSTEKEWLIEMKKHNPNSYICKTKEGNQKIIQVFNVSSIIFDSKLKTKIITDSTRSFFQNNDQYHLYLFLEQFFDDYFFNNYFKDNNLVKFIDLIDELLSYIPEETIQNKVINNGYICQFSHYHAFISKLDEYTKKEVCTKFSLLEQKVNHLRSNFPNKNNDLKYAVNEVIQTVQKLILEKKIDFYSPHTRQEYLVLDKFASPEHRKTVVDDDFQVYFQYSVPIISARWIINIIYEKMILMGFTVLEKFFMNYCLTKRHEKLKL